MSKMVTVSSRPLLVKPRPRSGARAIPCTPGVSGMSPTFLPESAVEHDDVGAARDVERRALGIDGEVIPATIAAHLVSFDHVVSRTSGSDSHRRQGHTDYCNPATWI